MVFPLLLEFRERFLFPDLFYFKCKSKLAVKIAHSKTHSIMKDWRNSRPPLIQNVFLIHPEDFAFCGQPL